MVADETQDEYDQQQRNKLGTMVILMGGGILLMLLIPNPVWGRLIFLACAFVLVTIGLLLKKSARLEPKHT